MINLFETLIQEVRASAILELRTRVLRPHFPPSQQAHFDGDEASTTHHFAAYHRGDPTRVLAAVSYFDAPFPEDNQPAVQLRGMAVAPQYRRQGLGAHLLQTTLARLPFLYPTRQLVWCNARETALPFYQAQGFQLTGHITTLSEIGLHHRMTRQIPLALA